ncbi:MAG: [Fe-Fe] hydrogenase large subunit C-terminal domain-containing protein [Clostridiaceae bacterium]|nr:[Fe-Fe] hydrogenase large subunit C-terminal domain-containing protein [Clostridiaceae bacterium]
MSEHLKLKKSNCKNCYKCIRHCPVKSIRFSAGQANISPEECILCGQCFVVCPQNAKEIVSELEKTRVLLMSGDPVYVSLAPSFMANYNGVGIGGMTEALLKLGFSGVEETAIGATIVKKEYERILREERPDVLISSCCPSVNLLIQKYFPAALPHLAAVDSPMQAHCKDIKRRFPGAKTVFIGPCVAKKDEAERYPGGADAVLTFEELSQWMEAEGVTPKGSAHPIPESRARLFPTAGGILKTMDCDQLTYTYLSIDGAENCISALRDLERGEVHHCFIEMSICAGSCIGGPVMEKFRNSPVRDFALIRRNAGPDDFPAPQPESAAIHKEHAPLAPSLPMPSEAEISAVLRQMGKTKPEHELNCGSCGYDSCRDKAIAVCQGKADLTMCLPFLKDKAESFSDNILRNTPNGILVLNEELEVQQINKAALSMMNLRDAADVLGEPLVRILDPTDFFEVKRTGRDIFNKRVYLAEYERYADETVIYDRDYRVILCILRDVTDEESARAERKSINRQTIETADKVVEKQMRVVQEIASLLGETAAETKIALTRLKETIHDE